MKKFIISFQVILLLLAGCSKIKVPETSLVGRVGKTIIFERDIQLTRSAIEACFPDLSEKMSDEAAFTYLLKGLISEEICRNWGCDLEKEITEKEQQELLKKCDSPQLLNEIFNNNKKLLFKDFVIPQLATRKLFSKIYNGNPEAHRKSFKRAVSFLKDLSKGENLKYIAQKYQARLFIVTYDKKSKNFTWTPTGKRYPYGNPITTIEDKAKYLQVAKKLIPGKVYQSIVEQVTGFEVFKMLENTPDHFTLLLAYFPKTTWNEFYTGEANRITIIMKDPSYYQAIKDKVDWLQGVKVIY